MSFPTGRYDRESRTREFLNGPGEGVLRSYQDRQAQVKGYVVETTVPWPLYERAEAAGVIVEGAVRAGGLAGLLRSVRAKEGGVTQDRSGRSDLAAEYRLQLGNEIKVWRQKRKLTRREFSWRVVECLKRLDIPYRRGWGVQQPQQWEIGRSAPREIEPLILALEVDDETADRWRGWWGYCRRGAASEHPVMEAPKGERSATERLRETLLQGKERLKDPGEDEKEGEVAADPTDGLPITLEDLELEEEEDLDELEARLAERAARLADIPAP